MTVFWTAASGCALAGWCTVAFARAGAFRTRERLAPAPDFDPARTDLSDVTVLVPARDEVAAVGRTLAALGRQGHGLEVVLVDDCSRDGTADAALTAAFAAAGPGAVPRLQLRLLRGRPLEPGWGGKLWALEQGLELVTRHYTLLLDADIELADGMVAALREKARLERLDLVSIMARLNCTGWWERLLVPPFVFFFKLIYPFAWVNDPRRRSAAAAGGCIFVRTDVLRRVGAFGSLRDALIDDCTLAARIKQAQHSIWLGMSDSVRSLRRYERLGEFWAMVSRTAYTQLGYSPLLLVLVTLAMLVAFVAPLVGVAGVGGHVAATMGGAALLVTLSIYLPMTRFYDQSPAWVFALPLAAGLYMLMTWSSALAYWRGVRATWKDRRYEISK